MYHFLIKRKMTTDKSCTTVRFRHIDANDIIYVGEVEINEERGDFGEPLTDLTILSCWRIGTTIEQINPYHSRDCSPTLRNEILTTALEQRMTPPATPVELPTDWEEFEVLDVSHAYCIQSPAELPEVMNDLEKKAHGLQNVSRIVPLYDNKYIVQCGGTFEDMRRELSRVKIH